MSTKTKSKKSASVDSVSALRGPRREGEGQGKALARVGLDPAANAMSTACRFAKGSFGELSVTGLSEALGEYVAAAKDGDLSAQRAMFRHSRSRSIRSHRVGAARGG